MCGCCWLCEAGGGVVEADADCGGGGEREGGVFGEMEEDVDVWVECGGGEGGGVVCGYSLELTGGAGCELEGCGAGGAEGWGLLEGLKGGKGTTKDCVAVVGFEVVGCVFDDAL